MQIKTRNHISYSPLYLLPEDFSRALIIIGAISICTELIKCKKCHGETTKCSEWPPTAPCRVPFLSLAISLFSYFNVLSPLPSSWFPDNVIFLFYLLLPFLISSSCSESPVEHYLAHCGSVWLLRTTVRFGVLASFYIQTQMLSGEVRNGVFWSHLVSR